MKKVFKFYLMLFLSITGTVFTTNAETKKILVVGNSFSFDAGFAGTSSDSTSLQEMISYWDSHIKEELH